MKYLLFTLLLIYWPQQQEHKIGLDLEIGNTYTQRYSFDFEMSQRTDEEAVSGNSTINVVLAFKVLDYKKGVYTMETTYKKLEMELSGGDMTTSVSSESGDTKIDQLLKAMVNLPFTVKMSRTGEVLKVSGIKKALNDALKAASMKSVNDQVETSINVKDLLSKEAFSGVIELMMAIFPEQAYVNIGDSLTSEVEAEVGVATKIITTFKLVSVDEKAYNIAAESELVIDDNNIGMEKPDDGEIVHDIEGNLKGTYLVDPQTNWIISADLKIQLSGTINVILSNGDIDLSLGMDLAMKMKVGE